MLLGILLGVGGIEGGTLEHNFSNALMTDDLMTDDLMTDDLMTDYLMTDDLTLLAGERTNVKGF